MPNITNSCCSVVKSYLTIFDPMDCSMRASLSVMISQSLLTLMCIESMMTSNHLILCRALLFLPSIFPSIRVFSNESFSSVQFSHSVVSDYLWPHELEHARPPSSSPTPEVHSVSYPLSQWCHPTISSSIVSFSSCLQSSPASGSFQMSQLFTSGEQSIGVSDSTSVLVMNTQDWSPLGWTGWIFLQSKGLWRVFST